MLLLPGAPSSATLDARAWSEVAEPVRWRLHAVAGDERYEAVTIEVSEGVLVGPGARLVLVDADVRFVPGAFEGRARILVLAGGELVARGVRFAPFGADYAVEVRGVATFEGSTIVAPNPGLLLENGSLALRGGSIEQARGPAIESVGARLSITDFRLSDSASEGVLVRAATPAGSPRSTGAASDVRLRNVTIERAREGLVGRGPIDVDVHGLHVTQVRENGVFLSHAEGALVDVGVEGARRVAIEVLLSGDEHPVTLQGVRASTSGAGFVVEGSSFRLVNCSSKPGRPEESFALDVKRGERIRAISARGANAIERAPSRGVIEDCALAGYVRIEDAIVEMRNVTTGVLVVGSSPGELPTRLDARAIETSELRVVGPAEGAVERRIRLVATSQDVGSPARIIDLSTNASVSGVELDAQGRATVDAPGLSIRGGRASYGALRVEALLASGKVTVEVPAAQTTTLALEARADSGEAVVGDPIPFAILVAVVSAALMLSRRPRRGNVRP